MANTNAIGRIIGDYIVLSKTNEKKSRSKYLIKCLVCGSIIETYNIPKNKTHSEQCTNFCNNVLGEKHNDYVIVKAYKTDRTYVDLTCMVCGSVRKKVAYKDVKLSFKNAHGKHCTITNTNHYEDKLLVRKLIRTFANIKTRLYNKNKSTSTYLSLTTDFVDTTDFVTHMYPMYEARLMEGCSLSSLSTDRIDTRLGYLKSNVRCLTLSEQQENRLNSRVYYIEDKKYSVLRSFCKDLGISEKEFYKFYNSNAYRNEFEINMKKAVVINLYSVETIE